jgi:monofunctional biosynthetic peptidoglycan transglycosylase
MVEDKERQEVTEAPSRIKRAIKWLWFIFKWTALGFLVSTLLAVVLFSFINPPVTPLMVKRALIRQPNGSFTGIRKSWVSLREISPHMVRAVVASEDNRFVKHWGIDMQAVQKAVEHNKRHRRKHGASTISQQVAKNVFLWPARTYLRKGFELYFTLLIETCWSKRRIMVVYLNVIETGNGMYGIEAAARRYFNKPAARLTKSEAALIAAAIPNPRKRNPARPTSYLIRRQVKILNLMNKIGKVEL